MPPFAYKTEPFPLQHAAVEQGWSREFFAYLWQQRCGKSKVLLDDAGRNWCAGVVDALVITAPAGVHITWAREQIPQHLSDAVPHDTWVWSSREAYAARRKAEALGAPNLYTERFKHWVERTRDRLAIFTHNIDSVNTPYGAAVLKYLLTHRRCLWVVDEADDLTDPTSARSKTLLALARLAARRRVLSGSLADGGPFAYYAPMAFLTADFWTRDNPRLPNVTLYKRYFAEFEERQIGGRTPQRVFVLAKTADGRKKYRNFETFRRLVAPHVSRVLQADVYPHLAALQRPHVATEFCALDGPARALYRDLRRQFLAETPSGTVVDGQIAATRAMRLHQIACGYVGTPDLEGRTRIERIPGPNVRIQALLRVLARIGPEEQVVVWTAFQEDQRWLTEALADAGYRVARYDGANVGTREQEKRAFLDGSRQLLLANMQAASRGHDFSVANHEVFYSYPDRLLYYTQACERLKGPRQTRPIFRHWIVALGTVDEKIRRSYQHGLEIAAALTGDPATDLLDTDSVVD